jgi:hypothetical protein
MVSLVVHQSLCKTPCHPMYAVRHRNPPSPRLCPLHDPAPTPSAVRRSTVMLCRRLPGSAYTWVRELASPGAAAAAACVTRPATVLGVRSLLLLGRAMAEHGAAAVALSENMNSTSSSCTRTVEGCCCDVGPAGTPVHNSSAYIAVHT